MAKKNQSTRLTTQHKKSQGVVGIFGDEAKLHDLTVGQISNLVITQLQAEYPQLTFQYKTSIRKEEINEALKKIKGISEDDVKNAEAEVQKITDDSIAKIDAMMKKKDIYPYFIRTAQISLSQHFKIQCKINF